MVFELHKKINFYFIKIYYLNETYSGHPHLLKIGICNEEAECSYDKFHEKVKKYYFEDFDVECDNQENNTPNSTSSNYDKSSLITVLLLTLFYINRVGKKMDKKRKFSNKQDKIWELKMF